MVDLVISVSVGGNLLPAGFVMPDLLSDSITEYSISGLEAPLAFFFSAISVALVLHFDHTRFPISTLSLLALVSAGIFLTRFDLVLLFAPSGVMFLLNQRKRLTVRMLT